MRNLLTIILLCIFVLISNQTGAVEADIGTPEQRDSGKVLYEKLCSQCHGMQGDGKGVAYSRLKPWPRNFKKGIYKFKTTPDDRLPTTADMIRVIRQGNPYTGMPAWPDLTDDQVKNLVYYIKSFSPDFSNPESLADKSMLAPVPLKLPTSAPAFSKDAAEKGKKLFIENKCVDCHGPSGRGSGTSAPTTEDIDSNQIRPRDFTKRWTFRNGSSRQDIFRTISTGISPMPSFHNLSEEERWQLVDFVTSLGDRDEAGYGTVVLAQAVTGALDLSKGQDLFKNAPAVYFPVIGQVVQPGRAFYASADGVTVKSVYNNDEIAFLLTWHDMSAQVNKESAANSASGGDDEGWGDEGDDFWDAEGGAAPAAGTKVEQKNAPDLKVEENNQEQEKPAQYADAVAIQIPSQPVEGVTKPYFILGDKNLAVDLWFADLAHATDKADLYVAKGASDMKKGDEDISFKSSYEDGQWMAIFKRKRMKEKGISFKEKEFAPVAFSFWDGFNNERGNKRGLTEWFHVYLEPLQKESATGRVALAVLVTIILESGLVYLLRNKIKNQKV